MACEFVFTAIAAVAAAAAAIASYVSIVRSNQIRKQEIEASRPSFMIDLSKVQISEEQGYFIIKIPFSNYGRRAAVNCISELKIWQKKDQDSKVICNRKIDLPQTIFPQSDLVWREKIRSIEENYTEYRIICGIRYYDSVLKKDFCDFIVRTWPRGPDGKPALHLEVPPSDEYQHFRNMFENELHKYIEC